MSLSRTPYRKLTKAQLIDGYEEWFLQFIWALWGTLTFRNHPSFSRANHLFLTWIAELRTEVGRRDFRWVRVAETGAFQDNLHFHVLIGGLRNCSKYPPMFRWEELAGLACLQYFDPQLGGLRYMLKTVEPGKSFAIDFSLPPQKRETV